MGIVPSLIEFELVAGVAGIDAVAEAEEYFIDSAMTGAGRFAPGGRRRSFAPWTFREKFSGAVRGESGKIFSLLLLEVIC